MSKKYLLFIVIAAVVSVSLAAQSDKLFVTRIEIRDGQKFLVITGYSGNEKSIIIPAAINGIPVRKIDNASFKLKGLTGVVLPQGLETIGEQAFRGNKLSVINIPSSVKVIADSAFDSNILKNVTSGGMAAVPSSSYMVTKNSVTNNVKEDVKVYYVASDSKSQKDLNASKELSQYANFYDPLTGYDGVYKPVLNSAEGGRPASSPVAAYSGNSVKSVTVVDGGKVATGGNAPAVAAVETAQKGESGPPPAGKFADAGKSQGYAIVTNAESGVGKFAYRNKNLDYINIPDGTTYIGEGAFYSNNLNSVIIPASVRFIGSQAFMGNNLGAITIGENVLVQYDSFRYQFSDYYRMNDFKAGTYILKAGHWNYEGKEPSPKKIR